MSGAFSVLGCLFALWVAKSNGSSSIVKGILYFVAMETLQFVQYQFIAEDIDPANPTLASMEKSPQCQTQANRFLTWVGLLHIAFQPYYSAHLSCAFVKSEANQAQFKLVHKLQLIGGCLILCRYWVTLIPAETFEAYGISTIYAFDKATAAPMTAEWLSGPTLCTYKGFKHLAWSIPFAPVSYYMPSMGLHSFLMFMPFFAMDHGGWKRNIGNWVAGVILFVSGPVLGDMLTPNKHEAASIWCFFSIMQVVGLVLLIVFQKHAYGKWFVGSNAAVSEGHETRRGSSGTRKSARIAAKDE